MTEREKWASYIAERRMKFWQKTAASRKAPSKRTTKSVGRAVGQWEVKCYPKIVGMVRKSW